MPLRILHVTPYSAGAWAYGGIPRLTDTLTRELARLGHQVSICTTDACDRSRRLSPVPDKRLSPREPTVLEDGVVQHVFPNVSNRLAYHGQCFTPIGMREFLRKHARQFDVAHVHACRHVPGVVAARELDFAGVPYILAPNGTAARIERRLLTKRVFDYFWGDRVVASAAAVVAVSQAERDQLTTMGVPVAKIVQIPNPIDLDEFRDPVPAGLFRKRFELGSAPIVLYLGKLTPRKRVDVLVKAFAKLARPEARLVIAGNDMGAGGEVRRLVRALDLESRTTFTGLLEQRERLEALADADVTVYPSQHEVFGLVPIEALLCGSPVVVADDSGCGQIIAGIGGGHVVALGDVLTLASAIDGILSDAGAWRADVEQAARRARATYGGRIVAEQVEALYEEVCRRATRVSPQPRKAKKDQPPEARGVSFLVPVRNGAPWIAATIAAIRAQRDGRPMEILAIDDASEDGSDRVLAALAGRDLRVISGAGKGAAAAMNLGLRYARYPIICQVDQDVVIERGWMARLVTELEDPLVAAVQGQYVNDRRAHWTARVMALDLQQRYASIAGSRIDHVCTGNSAYRASALREVGGFDERLGYGYDNDLSYRLRAAGHRLVFRRDARSRHAWREGLTAFWRQQYGFGYGRLEVVAKHPSRATGDAVSPARMMLHPAVMILAFVCGAIAAASAALGGAWLGWTWAAAGLVAALGVERLAAGIAASRRFGDRAALLFPIMHLYRDLAWVAACVVWTSRRVIGVRGLPADSMRPRTPAASLPLPAARPAVRHVLGLIPAHNEATTLPAVIAEMRHRCPDIDLLVIDDGSTDETGEILAGLDVRWLRLPSRMGVGSAMRAGLRYASQLGYHAAVRLDGDGQHRAGDIERMLAPIRQGRADVVLGSRFADHGTRSVGPVRLIQSSLAFCLSALTGRRVTDPTSGFCALSRRAIRLLADHHPTGYPEPELQLFLSRNRLVAVEVPVRPRRRLGGRTSLTPVRLTAAGLRVLLAMIIVPWRSAVGIADGD